MLSRWTEHYFVLANSCLYYFEVGSQSIVDPEPLGMIQLVSVEVHAIAKDQFRVKSQAGELEHVKFKPRKPAQYVHGIKWMLFRADSQELRDKWLYRVKSSVVYLKATADPALNQGDRKKPSDPPETSSRVEPEANEVQAPGNPPGSEHESGQKPDSMDHRENDHPPLSGPEPENIAPEDESIVLTSSQQTPDTLVEPDEKAHLKSHRKIAPPESDEKPPPKPHVNDEGNQPPGPAPAKDAGHSNEAPAASRVSNPKQGSETAEISPYQNSGTADEVRVNSSPEKVSDTESSEGSETDESSSSTSSESSSSTESSDESDSDDESSSGSYQSSSDESDT
jgi:hypothetical protein